MPDGPVPRVGVSERLLELFLGPIHSEHRAEQLRSLPSGIFLMSPRRFHYSSLLQTFILSMAGLLLCFFWPGGCVGIMLRGLLRRSGIGRLFELRSGLLLRCNGRELQLMPDRPVPRVGITERLHELFLGPIHSEHRAEQLRFLFRGQLLRFGRSFWRHWKLRQWAIRRRRIDHVHILSGGKLLRFFFIYHWRVCCGAVFVCFGDSVHALPRRQILRGCKPFGTDWYMRIRSIRSSWSWRLRVMPCGELLRFNRAVSGHR